MSKRGAFWGMLIAALVLAAPAAATTYTFSSFDGSNSDVFDLDHYYLYIWGINAGTMPSNETVVSASLFFDDIRDWTPETDILKVYLLDNPMINDLNRRVDIISIKDGQGTSPGSEMMAYLGTRFSAGTQVWSWSDEEFVNGLYQPNSQVHDLTYNFDLAELTALNTYLGTPNTYRNSSGVPYNSTFGIGFDPDCHYYNKGITLTLVTKQVPEPGTLLLLGTGLLGMGLLRRKQTTR